MNFKMKKGEGRAGRLSTGLGGGGVSEMLWGVDDFPRSITRYKLYLSIKCVDPVTAIFEVV